MVFFIFNDRPEQLVLRIQKKDIIGFEKLYGMYWENICGGVNTIVRDKSLAEKITKYVLPRFITIRIHTIPRKEGFLRGY